MSPIPKVEIRKVQVGRTDPKTGKPALVDHLGDIAKHLLATSPAIRAKNRKQLSEELGIPYTVVREWFEKGTSPNLENLSIICGNLNTDVVQFFLQWHGFTHTTASRHGVLFDRIAAILSKPEYAQKLLAILLEWQKLGILETFIDAKAAELGVNPDHPIRSIERAPLPRKKKRT